MTKREARAWAKARRAELDMAAVGRGMAQALFSLPQWQSAGAVLAFAAMPDEPDTAEILRRALADGKRQLLPRVRSKTEMDWVEIPALRLLRPGAFGIQEPPADLPAGERVAAIEIEPSPAIDRIRVLAIETAARHGFAAGSRVGRVAGVVHAEIVAIPAEHALHIGEHVFLDGLVQRCARFIGNIDAIAGEHQPLCLGCHRTHSWMSKQFARLGFERKLLGRDQRGREQALGENGFANPHRYSSWYAANAASISA